MITPRERLQICLSGGRPDRPPVALWRHFPVDDQTPETLAAATLHFQQTYGWDLVKVTPASSFCLRDWGARDEWQGDPEGTRRYVHRVIRRPQDWERLKPLEPRRGWLGRQLECLRLLRRALGPDVPLLQTIFNPLAQAKNLAGGEVLLAHLRQAPEAVLRGLKTIRITTERFLEAAIETGVDGVFYAVQHAQAGLLSEEEFARFSRPDDLRLLSLARERLWFNLLHAHGENVYFDLLAGYPVQALNWHDRETPPSLAQGLRKFDGLVCGGLRRETVALGDPQAIRAEAQEALRATRSRRFLLGTGCVVPIIAPHGNLLAARRSVEERP